MKIFLATPAFDGRVHVPFAISLAETATLLLHEGIPFQYQIQTSGSLLCAERNRLMKAFLETDCTHVLCVDSDLGWPCQAVTEMLKKDVPCIAGVYPARQEYCFLFRPYFNDDGSVVAWEEKQLLRMEYIPAGFMLIQRCVIEKILEMTPHLAFQPKDPQLPSGHAFFNTEIRDGEFWGEDYTFCRLVREAGYDIWVDPMIEFDHAGRRGMLMNVLTKDRPDVITSTNNSQLHYQTI